MRFFSTTKRLSFPRTVPMIAIYKGEDTDFAGQEPFLIKINTPLDLTGYTAKLLFGNVVKEFDSEQVGEKTLRLSFSAADTLDFYPGKGYASVQVFDTDNRVAILKRFIIDVRFRRPEDSAASMTDVSEVIQSFENIRNAVADISALTEEDDTATIKDVINVMLDAAKERTEFSAIPVCALKDVPPSAVMEFVNCIRNLESLAKDAESLDEDKSLEDIKERINEILTIFGGGKTIHFDIEDPAASVKQLTEWAKEVNKALRTQKI